MKSTIKRILLFCFTASVLWSCNCDDYDEPTSLISKEAAIQMHQTYLNNQHQIINDSLGIIDYTDVTFDFEDFENFIKKAKHIARDSGYTDLGLRVYFAANRGGDGIARSTVFVVPTYNVEDPGIEGGGDDDNMDLYYNMGDVGNNTDDLNND